MTERLTTTSQRGPIASKALCISLCTGVHSARPLIPGVVRVWWGDGGGISGRARECKDTRTDRHQRGRRTTRNSNNRNGKVNGNGQAEKRRRGRGEQGRRRRRERR